MTELQMAEKVIQAQDDKIKILESYIEALETL